ncbi:hypothetical protein AA0312_1073 [Acetobacter tropicalis NRIC 0312]|uniref:Uncharacterized protein n=1 Tax=Acetobacter tropicalis TaxID=104102 RepID=A0A0C9LKD7_9PROT|nr:hypothetical protein AD944_04200 [Acetobacter tropicalis]KXV55881.1 hypothetical protein AD947_14055 [Acetobacter tropicalis]GAL98954.1 hypothetical protein ATR1_443c0016 [Acetobacter tropicalis]GBR68770.1 hypothetical protein AA0312_1073 [Acetobacter tropicalis NRIC 0312]GEL51447.1 hypothetical protein ATR01nite_25220 [Acetobacter tropicalis]
MGGLSGIPDILAAFVLPNDPAIARILRSASEILRQAGQSPSLEGYQGDKVRVSGFPCWKERRFRKMSPALMFQKSSKPSGCTCDTFRDGKFATTSV